MSKILSFFKVETTSQDEVYEGGVVSVLLAIGKHMYLSITNLVQAIGYSLYLCMWLVYFAFCLFGIGMLLYYLYLVASALF